MVVDESVEYNQLVAELEEREDECRELSAEIEQLRRATPRRPLWKRAVTAGVCGLCAVCLFRLID